MRQIELAAEGFVSRSALAKEFGNAEDGSERIVQLVSDASKHLAHGGEFFRLDELLFEALDVGAVAASKDHAFDVTPFIVERNEGETNAAPVALLAEDTELHRSNGMLAGQNGLLEGCGRRQLLRTGRPA